MMKKQQGFTLIELVAVIVILGALAVVALPRFINLQSEAEQAAAEGVAGAVSAAFATNYAASLVKDSDTQEVTWANADDAGPEDYVLVNSSATLDKDGIDRLMQGTPLANSNLSVSNCAASDFDGPGSETECDLTPSEGSFAPTVSFTAIATSSNP